MKAWGFKILGIKINFLYTYKTKMRDRKRTFSINVGTPVVVVVVNRYRAYTVICYDLLNFFTNTHAHTHTHSAQSC